MFRKVLIANRGVIARRIVRTLRRMGVGSVAVFSDADRHSPHVFEADEAVWIGPAPAALSYLSIPALLDAAQRSGADAIHPGYGFLSENAEFASQCNQAGIRFIGPTPDQMRAFGWKHRARSVARANGVPMLPGTDLLENASLALEAAEAIGYPVMLKSTAGGGGIGMRLCLTDAELLEAFEAVERLSRSSFGAAGLYLEKFVTEARHIEVQIFGDGRGQVVALGERDCSAQRRNQKVIEETPAAGLSNEIRKRLFDCAIRLGESVQYESAGTVEFIFDQSTGAFYFLEVNTRLQVEHGVTEEVTGVDLVEWMVRQAAGQLDLKSAARAVQPGGSSIQVRLYAEDPAKNFQPSAGQLTEVVWPEGVRLETWIDRGTEVTPYYDPLLAKLIVRGRDRTEAVERLQSVLQGCRLAGIETNLEYLTQICASPEFAAAGIATAFLSRFVYCRRDALEVLDAGTQTTVQDCPGRLGYWHVGVPPSGPMDALAFQLANRLAGSPGGTAGLEFVVTGPWLRFPCDALVALGGADFGAKLDGQAVERWRSIFVAAGSVLDCGTAAAEGARGYLAIAGGFAVPEYLGSRATFLLGKFGGHAGRALRAGDVLPIGPSDGSRILRKLQPELVPQYGQEWEIGVLYGPHGAPDFFTPSDIDTFFSTAWKVHYHSDRTGVRLIGPKPEWARPDGGEAGLHPSNIHDNAYAIGAIDFTGDMPVILGPDGPSLGGFVCPAVVAAAELWKLGQLRPGDRVRFRALSISQAEDLERRMEAAIDTLEGELPQLPTSTTRGEPVLRRGPASVYRSDGDRYLLVEYGPNVLDLNLRFRVAAIERELRALALPGIVDITPGVRSLHIHYRSPLRREALLDALEDCERRIPELDDIAMPSRIVHLPLSWDDPATQLAIRKYTQSVRPDAPWCPSNIEFIRRINGLPSVADVQRIVFEASYLVLGLGDVYLGAPVATPVDPRHRLVTTKYNPARTWTPENAVGIGGAYLCVYGMEGPGGYQFVGRTVQMWNTFRSTAEFEPGTPWLLRFFDRLHFFPVDAEELLDIRQDFPHGSYRLRIEDGEFRLADYDRYLRSIDAEARDFKRRQQEAFVAERDRWAALGIATAPQIVDESEPATDAEVPEGCQAVRAPLAASVWSVAVEPGQYVRSGQKLVVLEAMKMEIAVAAPADGVIEQLNCVPGAVVSAGQHLVTLRGEVLT